MAINETAQKIIAYLLTEGRAIPDAKLMEGCECTKSELKEALASLEEDSNHPLKLITSKKGYALAVDATLLPEPEEVGDTLSQALLQTLTVVAYAGAITKPEIDAIRGVNSRHALQTLVQQGYVEHDDNHRFSLSVDGLAFLGVGAAEELPDYQETREKLLEGFAQPKEMVV